MEVDYSLLFPFPKWTQQERFLIDWFKKYVDARTVTKDIYTPLLREIDKGPTNQNRKAIMTKLNQAHYLVEGSFVPGLSAVALAKEEI